jgi:hypothetical protein
MIFVLNQIIRCVVFLHRPLKRGAKKIPLVSFFEMMYKVEGKV